MTEPDEETPAPSTGSERVATEAGHEPAARSGLVDFLVIGAMKSGTSTLATYLGSHPDVQMPEREVHYFDRHYAEGPVWYRAKLGDGPPGARYGEGSPQYLYWEESIARIAADVPDALLIAILRDPVGRAYSHYWHNRARGHEPLSFRDALAAEAERMDDEDPRVVERFAYRDLSRYDHQLARLEAYVDRSQVHVLLLESLKADPAGALQEVWQHLGLSPAPVESTAAVTRNRFVEYRSQRLRRPIRRLPQPIRRVASRLNIRYRPYPPMETDLRLQLTEEFAPVREAVAGWIGGEPGAWESGSG